MFKFFFIFKLIILYLVCYSAVYSQTSLIFDPKGSGGYSITSFDRIGERTIGGYLDTEFVAGDNKISTFKAHRLILDVSSQISNKILINSEIELEYAANTEYEGEIKIEQAWVDYQLTDFLTQRTGIIVMPFGRINVLHDSDVRDATQRPLYAKKIVPTTWSDVGFGFHGNSSLSFLDFNYSGYIVNGLGIHGSEVRSNFKQDNNGDKAFIGRLGISPMLGLEFGTSIYKGNYNDAANLSYLMVGGDLFYKRGRFEVVSEAAVIRSENTSSTDTALGGYLEFRMHVLQRYLREWMPSLKFPVITLFSRVGHVDLDRSGNDITNRVMVGFNFRPTESFVYKLEYQIEDYDKANNNSSEAAVYASVAVGF